MQDLEFQFSDFTDQADVNSNYDSFVTKYTKVVNRHALVKSYVIRGNQAPLMTKELANSIVTRSRLKKSLQLNKNEGKLEGLCNTEKQIHKAQKKQHKRLLSQSSSWWKQHNV